MNPVESYARAVVAGDVPAGKYHKLSAERHLRDLARQGTAGFPYRFDAPLGARIVEFIAQLKHYRGEWDTQSIVLQPWQVFIESSITGWVHVETGLRRFRMVFVSVPRKNGKTLIFACNGVYFVFFDNEPGAEGYFAAMKRDQSMIAFGDARKLVEKSGLKSRIRVQVGNLHRDATSSKLEPLGSDTDTLDGLNPHFVGIDEYHKQKTRELPDVLETAMAARRQPVFQKITTAGDDLVSPCGDEHIYACQILEGIVEDERYFCFISHADDGDDWLDERTWAKANPNYGISVKPDDMRALAAKAVAMPSAAATFKQKRLNIWVNASNPCLSVEGWRKGQTSRAAWTVADMLHEPCYVGVDLASKIDLCALSFVFPPAPGRQSWRLLQYLWTPADTLADRAHRDRAPYQTWVDQGWLIATPGTSIDHDLVRQAILVHRADFDIQQIGFDPWHADAPIKALVSQDGFAPEQVLSVPQTYAGLSSACLRMQAEILAGLVDARGCPVTAWAVSNTVDQRDGKDNMQFIKKKSRGRIDPVIAATVGMSLAIRREAIPENIYLSRGIRRLGA